MCQKLFLKTKKILFLETLTTATAFESNISCGDIIVMYATLAIIYTKLTTGIEI
jgi:hypothetical protein